MASNQYKHKISITIKEIVDMTHKIQDLEDFSLYFDSFHIYVTILGFALGDSGG